jgi:superfamily I DNA/RNA helicase
VLGEEGSIGVIVADDAVVAVRRALTAAGVPHEVLGDLDREEDEAADGQDRPADGTTEDAAPIDAGLLTPVRVSVVPATLAKGLEFDSVVVVEPAAIVEAEPRGLRRLYVVLTRAVSRLVVVHHRPLPAQLSA